MTTEKVVILLLLVLIVLVNGKTLHQQPKCGHRSISKQISSALLGGSLCLSGLPVGAKTELPSVDKCFEAVRIELAPNGQSLQRLRNDIDKNDWEDVKLFTREYDAGFRNGVLKNIWKQMEDDNKKKRGISLSNSFTFDLIGLNKAARNKDRDEAMIKLGQVRKDLEDFLLLEL